MISKRLESILANATKCGEAEMVQRFQKLRDIRLLPTSRGKNAEELALPQIAAGILSVVASKPAYAGMMTNVLLRLLPVGGQSASYYGSETFEAALATILQNDQARESLLEVRVSDSEMYINSAGRAAVIYRENGEEKTVYFVRKEALSLLQPGMEKKYNPRDLIASSITETVFYPPLFNKIARTLKEEQEWKRVNTLMDSQKEYALLNA